MHRRHFLSASVTALCAAGIRPAFAAGPAAADLKFIFLFNNGGWDPTRVFADQLDSNNVDMEPDADRASAGGIGYIDHPSRPSVRAFFEGYADRALVINGMQVRSIAHEICTMIALTGSTSGTLPDWATLIAAAAGDRYTLPHLVLGGPSFPGSYGTAVARTGAAGQLEGLLSGRILDQSDLAIDAPSRAAQGIVDAYLARRGGARVLGAQSSQAQRLTGAYADALGKAAGLKDYRYVMDFTGGAGLEAQAAVAVDALGWGLSRCVTLGFPGAGGGLGWDTHANNDEDQSTLWEGLFAGINQLMGLLESTAAPSGAPLSEETVVVVLSELGRTPLLNATLGKDHWPYTSMMLVGPGLTTDRVVGAYDEGHTGLGVDMGSAEVADDGPVLAVEAVGAALLQLAGLDPAEHIADADPLSGILA
jgi:hypothetical protein